MVPHLTFLIASPARTFLDHEHYSAVQSCNFTSKQLWFFKFSYIYRILLLCQDVIPFCKRVKFNYFSHWLFIFSFFLPCTLSLKKQSQIRSFIQSTKWCHTVALKELSRLQQRLGTSSCREERPGNFTSLWPAHIFMDNGKRHTSINPVFHPGTETDYILFYHVWHLHLFVISELLLCCLDMFETWMKFALFTEVWVVSCTNHFVQLNPCLAFDGSWPHK